MPQAVTQDNPAGTTVPDGSVPEPELTEEGLQADLAGGGVEETTDAAETPGAEETPTTTEPEAGETPPTVEPTVMLDGKSVPAKDVMAWRESHQKVTQELQNVARMQKELAPLQQVVDFSRRNPQFREAFQAVADNASNPAVLAKILAATGRASAGAPAPGGQGPASGVPPEFLGRLEQLENEIRSQKSEAQLGSAMERLRNTTPALKDLPPANWNMAQKAIHDFLSSYAGNDWLLKFAGENVDWDRILKTAYYAASHENAVAFAYQKGQEEATAKAARNKAAPAPKPRGGSAGGAPPSNILESGTEEEQRAELMKMFSQ